MNKKKFFFTNDAENGYINAPKQNKIMQIKKEIITFYKNGRVFLRNILPSMIHK